MGSSTTNRGATKSIGEAKDLAAVNAAIKPGEWNEYRIRAEGPRIQTWINGVPALDYTEADPKIAQDGHIGIQVHGGGKALVQVKDVTIEELPPTPNAPTWEKVGKPGGEEKTGRGGAGQAEARDRYNARRRRRENAGGRARALQAARGL